MSAGRTKSATDTSDMYHFHARGDPKSIQHWLWPANQFNCALDESEGGGSVAALGSTSPFLCTFLYLLSIIIMGIGSEDCVLTCEFSWWWY